MAKINSDNTETTYFIDLHVLKIGDKWVVVKTGAERALFSSDNKDESINYAVTIGKKERQRVYVHNENLNIKHVIPVNIRAKKIRLTENSTVRGYKKAETKTTKLSTGIKP